MKKPLILIIIFFSCQSSPKQLLKQLDKEELNRSIMSSDLIYNNDSLIKNSNLKFDSVFMYRNFKLKHDLQEQDRYIKDLKERIILEK